MLRVANATPHLFRAALGEVLRLFYLRGNEPLEWSALRLALQVAGVKAHHPNDWGSLAASLKESGVIELVGRQQALVASRNAAKNGAYRLTPLYYEMAQSMAVRRGWGSLGVAGRTVEQMGLDDAEIDDAN